MQDSIDADSIGEKVRLELVRLSDKGDEGHQGDEGNKGNLADSVEFEGPMWKSRARRVCEAKQIDWPLA